MSNQSTGEISPLKFMLWFALAIGMLFFVVAIFWPASDTFEVDVTDVTPPEITPDELFVDDAPPDKPPKFDPQRIDSRLHEDWQVNASAAVVRLDAPMIRPDIEPEFTKLYPSYRAAETEARVAGRTFLPSVNLIDGKAKQFDDGLYAAIDSAYYQGLKGKLRGHVELIDALFKAAGPDNPASAYLAAGLQLASRNVEVADKPAKARYLAEFRDDSAQSKPIGFYTWTAELSECFRFLRYFQREFPAGRLDVPLALAKLLGKNQKLRADYGNAVAFYERLTNPRISLSVDDLVGVEVSGADALAALCRSKRVSHQAVAVFPFSTSKETVLFERLFPLGLPANAQLMRELIRRIKSGEVDLTPRPSSGWYEHQVYALETLLLPGRGPEKSKLMLAGSYKRRMFEAFAALVTKRRETHVRQNGRRQIGFGERNASPAAGSRLATSARRTRANLLLRTANAYSYLANLLFSVIGRDELSRLRGLTATGPRPLDLAAELDQMRELFLGLYLLSAEDIGMEEAPLADKTLDKARCRQRAIAWLESIDTDLDLAADTRVCVPIYVDYMQNKTRLWATLGVRPAKLDAGYHHDFAPSVRSGPDGQWQAPRSLTTSKYVIAVDEFAEVELPGLRVLTRDEFRTLCDREQTKEAILKALPAP